MKELEQIKNQKIEEVKKANVVECVTELACQLSDILSLGAKANFISADKESDGVRYKGRVVFNIVYLLEGEVRRKELGIEFSDFCKVDNLETAQLRSNLLVEGVSAKKGEKLSLEAIVSVCIKVERTEENSLILHRENCLTHSKEEEITQLVSNLNQNFKIDDELEINKELKNVLCSGAEAQIYSSQCGLGNIICDGEIVLSLALLPKEEKSDIIKETRKIPFRLELEDSALSINDLACSEAKVEGVTLKVVIDEEKSKTNVSSQVDLTVYGKAYKVTSVAYLDDIFSVDKKLSVTKENLLVKTFIKQRALNQKISGKAFCIPPENSRIVCTLEDRVYGIGYKEEEDKIVLEGVASCYILFNDINSGAICSKLAEMPFVVEFNKENVLGELNVVCRGLQAKIRNDEVELEGEVSISHNCYKEKTFSAVIAVEEGEDLEKDLSAFKIYNPQEEDSLWEVAKVLRVTEQEILEQNPDLTFPLKGSEKIIIYKKA